MPDIERDEFFSSGGTLEPSSPSYVEREADDLVFRSLLAGEYVVLLDSRQKGKSSLVGRTVQRLRDAGVATALLDLQRIGANVTVEQWYAGLVAGIGQELGLTAELFDYWAQNRDVGPLARWLGALEVVVLGKLASPVVIVIDEIDFVRALPFSSDEFFSGIRDCYNRRPNSPEFERLTFCLVGSATPSQLVRTPDITPFNIGRRVTLRDFEVEDLGRYGEELGGSSRDGPELVRLVHSWTGGHPFLTQSICRFLAENPSLKGRAGVDLAVSHLYLNAEAIGLEPNLADTERRLLNPEVPGMSAEEARIQTLELYGKILKHRSVGGQEDNPLAAILLMSGVAALADGRLRVRNRLYETVFSEEWRKRCLPDYEAVRQRRLVVRTTLRVAGLALFLILLIASLAMNAIITAQSRKEVIQELRLKQRALESQNYSGRMAEVRIAMSSYQWQRAVELLEQAKGSGLAGWEWGHAWLSLNKQSWLGKLPPNSLLDGDPSGALIAYVHDGLFTLDRANSFHQVQSPTNSSMLPHVHRFGDRVVSLPEFDRFRLLDRKLGHAGGWIQGTCLDFDREHGLFLVRPSGPSPLVQVYDFAGHKLSTFKFHKAPNRTAKFLPDGTALSCDLSGQVARWRVGSSLLTVKGLGQPNSTQFVISPDSKAFVLTGEGYRNIEVFQTESLAATAHLGGLQSSVLCASFSPSGDKVALGCVDGSAHVYVTSTGEKIARFYGSTAGILSVVFADRDKSLFTIDRTGEVRSWRIGVDPLYSKILEHDGQANLIFTGAENDIVTTVGNDGLIKTLDRLKGSVTTLRAAPAGTVPPLACDENRAVLYLATPLGAIEARDQRSLSLKTGPVALGGEVKSLSISQNGEVLSVLDKKGNVAVVSAATLKTLFVVPQKVALTTSTALSGTGSLIAIGDSAGDARVYSCKTGNTLTAFKNPNGFAIRSLAFNAEESAVAAGTFYGPVLIASLSKKEPLKVLVGHTERAWKLLFSKDGSRLVTASFDGTARIWRVKDGALLATLFHSSWVPNVRFSPDGSRIVTCSDDGTVSVWRADTGDELTTFVASSKTVWDARFTSDGRDLLTCSSDGKVIAWHSAPWTR
ncbi:MAG: AAA-like domain-containing protein [Armatimonadetes bacterium]|nr:AAA-like domain-containing protein [Armatimonadota bacterium]